MRAVVFACALSSIALASTGAQTATVTAQTYDRVAGVPLGYTQVSVLTLGTERLADDSGNVVLANLPGGEIHLRFRRIGYAPRDTSFTLRPDESVVIRMELDHLAIQLPATVANGTCTNQTPREAKPIALAELFDQVKQNAERMRLLAIQRPFVIKSVSVEGFRNEKGDVIGKPVVDTTERGPLPDRPYTPRGVVYRGVHMGREVWAVKLPELPDLADTAFTNNHCFWYAGQERLGADSVIRVDFEPVPWLAKEVDLVGSIYLRSGTYQLVALETKLNRMPSWDHELTGRGTTARFSEIVPGVPVVTGSEAMNTFRNHAPFVLTRKVTSVRWLDSTATTRDTLDRGGVH